MSEDECVDIGACIPVNSAKEKPTQSTHHNLVMNSLPPCQELRSGRPIEHERNAPVRFNGIWRRSRAGVLSNVVWQMAMNGVQGVARCLYRV